MSIREYFARVYNHDFSAYASDVDVTLNALCYAFSQAEDYLDVVYLDASADPAIHFKQVQLLARRCWKRYMHCTPEQQNACHWWDMRIPMVAMCKDIEEYKNLDNDTDKRMLAEIDSVMNILNYCCEDHGAKVTITVDHDNGNTATANLYDHAALVQALIDALDYFKSEL